ncbi:MAG: STT3 domain-containing protein [Nanoarchaeota archaeon]
MNEDIISERKRKFIEMINKKSYWVFFFLIIALILGIYLRSLPMLDHGGKPGLWDITTNDWTLGPDLDPWLFTRYTKTIHDNGTLPQIDKMRNVPLGFDTTYETRLLPQMIIFLYHTLNLFGNFSIIYSAAIFPVIMFAFTILAFFLFVREIFIDYKDKKKANLIALISTFFMIVMPVFLSRTVAGIPEKESAAFFFMFLSFYFFLKSWKSKKIKFAIVYSILAGLITGLMGLIWGGVVYVFVAIALSTVLALILGKVNKKEMIVYAIWLISTLIVLTLFSNKYSIIGLLKSTDYMLSFITLFIVLVHFLIWETPISKKKIFENSKLPKSIISAICSLILGIVLVSIIFGVGFIPQKFSSFIETFVTPTTGRWGVTVAENKQPYFQEWAGSFGPFVMNFPVLFWIFFIGSIVLFKDALKQIKDKEAWILTGLYTFFFFGLVFSRYSSSGILNGENFISKLFYFGSALIFFAGLIYYYLNDYKKESHQFKNLNFEILFLFSLFILCLFTARSAVRLIMVLAPIAPIFAAYLIVFLIEKFKTVKEETAKYIIGIIFILILVLSVFAWSNFYQQTKIEAYSMVPNQYNQQWQKTMSWVRTNTSEDAVFSHWWDYGYWVQSIGERATVLDGGNAIAYWNYLMGRLVLTGNNEPDALNFLYSHNSTHLLIDSSDLGKYGAFSSIGSNKEYDRFSTGPGTLISDPKLIKETANGAIRIYNAPRGNGQIALFPLEEDIIYNDNVSQIYLFSNNAGLGQILIEISQTNSSYDIKQPMGIFYADGKQVSIPMRYLYYDNKFIDYGSGLEACPYLMQRIMYSNGQITGIDNMGALMYISPRLLRGYLAQKYLLNDPFNKFGHFKLVHSEPNLIIDSLNQQGANLNEFAYLNEVLGPIKIWEIEYTGKEEFKQEYVDTDYTKYLDWKL